MPDRLQLTTLHGRDFQRDPHNLEHMLRHLSVLDELCRSLGVNRISEFVDISLLELDEAARLLAQDLPAEDEADPVTGMALAIEDLVWHPAALGMASFEASSRHLERGVSKLIEQADVAALLEELRWCQTRLQPLETEGGLFHLGVHNSASD